MPARQQVASPLTTIPVSRRRSYRWLVEGSMRDSIDPSCGYSSREVRGSPNRKSNSASWPPMMRTIVGTVAKALLHMTAHEAGDFDIHRVTGTSPLTNSMVTSIAAQLSSAGWCPARDAAWTSGSYGHIWTLRGPSFLRDTGIQATSAQ